jgi:mannosyltransferase OCH1-like enzyme
MADHTYAKSSYRYVERFYKRYATQFDVERPSHNAHTIKKNDSIYWTCWLQGDEAAPAIVKACINAARKCAAGRKVIVITYENLETYIALPAFILQKHREGRIHATHFSDIIRAYLLYTYGGVWFDATVLFTQPIPEHLCKEPLFFFRSPLDDRYCPVSNWFIIASQPNNPVLYKLLCALLSYWQKKDTLIDYFIFHYFLNAIISHDTESANIFTKIPYWNNQNPHYVQHKRLFAPFDSEIWEQIKTVSFCHKLTYKVPLTVCAENENSFFSYIAHNNIAPHT